MMEESEEQARDDGSPSKDAFSDEGIDVHSASSPPQDASPDHILEGGVVRTLDGEIAGDEFAQDAINYQILLGKIDTLLDNLKLDA